MEISLEYHWNWGGGGGGFTLEVAGQGGGGVETYCSVVSISVRGCGGGGRCCGGMAMHLRRLRCEEMTCTVRPGGRASYRDRQTDNIKYICLYITQECTYSS